MREKTQLGGEKVTREIMFKNDARIHEIKSQIKEIKLK